MVVVACLLQAQLSTAVTTPGKGEEGGKEGGVEGGREGGMEGGREGRRVESLQAGTALAVITQW